MEGVTRREEISVSDEPPIRIYANTMGAHGGAYDVTLDFGFRLDDQPPEWGVRVSMSWEHVSSMIAALQRMVEDYQAKVGAIPDMATLEREAAERQQ